MIASWAIRCRAEIADLRRHLAERWYLYVLLAIVSAFTYHRILINITPSLPYTLIYLEKNATTFRRGDLIFYRWEGAGSFPQFRGRWFFKRVAGIAGDRITVNERHVFVNGRDVGFAKVATTTGIPLSPIEPIVIPNGFFYAKGDSENSFDSRYAESGLVRADQIVGRAHVLF